MSYSSAVPNAKIRNFGGYKYISWDRLSKDIVRSSLTVQFSEMGQYRMDYLRDLISELCQQKSVELILLNTPKHKYYLTNLDSEIKNNWIAVHSELQKDSLLDLSGFTLPDSCYGDLMHLNFKGANVFSSFLNEKLNSKSE